MISRPWKVDVTPKEGVPVTRPLDVDEIGDKAPPGVANALKLSPRSASAGSSKKRLLDRLLLSTYIPLLERIPHSMGMVASDPEGMLEISHRWNPLN